MDGTTSSFSVSSSASLVVVNGSFESLGAAPSPSPAFSLIGVSWRMLGSIWMFSVVRKLVLASREGPLFMEMLR